MKKAIMKQNKNTSVVKFFSSFLVFVFIVTFISVPSFAVDTYDFSNTTPVGYASTDSNVQTRWANGSTFVSKSSISFEARITTNTLDVDVLYFAYTEGANYNFCAVSDSSFSEVVTYNFGSGPSMTGSNWVTAPLDNSTNLYYANNLYPVGQSGATLYCPLYSSVSAGLAAYRDYLDNPPGPVLSPHPVNFSLQAGYVAFVDISNLTGVSASLSTAVFGSAEWSPRVTDQSLGVVSSLPSSFSLPISGTSRISWIGTGSKNVLGQYKTFGYSYSASSVGGSSYLCIVNPLQASQGAQLTAMASMPSARNNPISVSINSALSVKIFSLTSSLALGSGTLDTETNGNTWSGEYDDSSQQWAYSNDQTGEATDIDGLPVGGGNEPIIGETSINDWLQEIANNIKGFFSGAIGAVTTLVSAGSDFIHSLSGLYAWLPGPVYSVLTSALILVITIGVIKVFI